ncbi:UNVERIFIED_CONTAM: hypothetical protein GTU68_035957 [Idotea baltica]|nr:hypothetical protein [Idotea baltica]
MVLMVIVWCLIILNLLVKEIVICQSKYMI